MDDPWVAGLASGRIVDRLRKEVLGRLRGPLLVFPRSFAPGQEWDELCDALPRIRDAWYFPPGSRLELSPMELRMSTGSKELEEVWRDQGPDRTLCVARIEVPEGETPRIGFALARHANTAERVDDEYGRTLIAPGLPTGVRC